MISNLVLHYLMLNKKRFALHTYHISVSQYLICLFLYKYIWVAHTQAGITLQLLQEQHEFGNAY